MKHLTWAEGILPVLDFETTGVDVQNDRVIEAALIFEAPGGYLLPSSLTAYVNPGEEALTRMSLQAIETHNLKPELILDQGKDSLTVFLKMQSLLVAISHLGLPLVGFNVPFDWRLLHYEFRRHGLLDPPPLWLLDVYLLDQKLDKYRKGSRKLSAVAEHYGVGLVDAHTADADCVATAETLRRMLKRYPRFATYQLEEMYLMQQKWFETWKQDRNAYWEREGKDSRIDHCWPGM